MQKDSLAIKNTKGFSLAEAIVAVAIFSIITTSIAASYLKVSNYILSAGAERQAIFMAQEGLEAVRNIRDNNFSALVIGGPYGISTNGNKWDFSGSPDTEGIYTRKIIITAPNSDTREVTSKIEWTYKGEDKSLTLNREFTNWRKLKNRDPISLWPFDENTGCVANDSIGTNHGTLGRTCPGTSPIWTEGISNSALNFTANNQRVVVPDSDSLDLTTKGSMVAWVNLSAYNNYGGIIHKGQLSNFSDSAYFMQMGGSSIPGSNNKKVICGGHDGITDRYFISNQELSLNTWYHLVCTWDGDGQKMYINGDLNASTNTAVVNRITTGSLQIGSQVLTSYFFRGKIDEPALYNYALSDSQIISLYNNPIAGSIEILTPNGGESLTSGDGFSINWNSLNTSGDVKIEYSKDNFISDAHTIIDSTSDDGSYNWTIPEDESEMVKVRISDVDDATIFDTSNANFSIFLPANILIRYPNGNENLIVDTITTIQWESTNTSGDVKIEYSKDNFLSDVHTIISSTPDTENFSWNIPNDLSSTVRIRVTDIENSAVEDVSDANFTIAVKPVSLWLLDDNAGCSVSDLFGGNNGILGPDCPNNSATWTTGKIGSALSFDGLDDYVSFNNSSNLNPTTAITLKAWIKWNINPTTGQQWASIINKNADNQYRLQHNSTNTAFEFAVRTSAGNKWVTSITAPVQGIWYFVVGTYDGTSLKIYVNGLLENSASFSGNILTSTNPVTISRHSPTGRFFNGVIDEVSIYSIALSATDILNIYNSQK